jgi:hypothetical protein
MFVAYHQKRTELHNLQQATPAIGSAEVEVDHVDREDSQVVTFLHVTVNNEGRRSVQRAVFNFVFPRIVLAMHECDPQWDPIHGGQRIASPEPLLEKDASVPADLWITNDRTFTKGRNHLWFQMVLPSGGRYTYRLHIDSDDLPDEFIANGLFHV